MHTIHPSVCLPVHLCAYAFRNNSYIGIFDKGKGLGNKIVEYSVHVQHTYVVTLALVHISQLPHYNSMWVHISFHADKMAAFLY